MEIILAVSLGVIVGLIGWMGKRLDDKNEARAVVFYRKFDEITAELHTFKLENASQHSDMVERISRIEGKQGS